jgi:hypothetical protein
MEEKNKAKFNNVMREIRFMICSYILEADATINASSFNKSHLDWAYVWYNDWSNQTVSERLDQLKLFKKKICKYCNEIYPNIHITTCACSITGSSSNRDSDSIKIYNWYKLTHCNSWYKLTHGVYDYNP